MSLLLKPFTFRKHFVVAFKSFKSYEQRNAKIHFTLMIIISNRFKFIIRVYVYLFIIVKFSESSFNLMSKNEC